MVRSIELFQRLFVESLVFIHESKVQDLVSRKHCLSAESNISKMTSNDAGQISLKLIQECSFIHRGKPADKLVHVEDLLQVLLALLGYLQHAQPQEVIPEKRNNHEVLQTSHANFINKERDHTVYVPESEYVC